MADEYDAWANIAEANQKVFIDFKGHCDGHRVETQFVVLELLRNQYADFHVTCTWPSKCDFFGYATAGHATATLACDLDLDTMRYYTEPGPRLEKKPGVLKDLVRFGKWHYTWKDSKFLIYEVLIAEPMRGQSRMFYVLSPSNNGTLVDGHLSTTDDLLLAVGKWSTELHDEIYVMDEGNWSKSHDLWKSVQGCSWDEVILDTAMKQSLIEDVQGFFDNQKLYKQLSVPWKRGVILHGVPGNGKTVSIKAFINTLSSRANSIPSLYVKSFDGCQGAKYAIRSIFSHARIMAPCLLIFEDLDSLVTEDTRSYFLNEVDGLEANDGILMIGSTNNLDLLDPAIAKRPSRFDRKYHFQLPGEPERIAYCQFWRQKLADNDIVDFPEELCPIIAKMTLGFSFAYLKELFVWALLVIARGGSAEMNEEVFGNGKQLQDLNSGESTSDESVVIVEAKDAPPQPSNETIETDSVKMTTTTETAAQVEKTTIPDVQVPMHLNDNVLLRVIRSQISMLLEEMDNTKVSIKKRDRLPGADRVAVPTRIGPPRRLTVRATPFMG